MPDPARAATPPPPPVRLYSFTTEGHDYTTCLHAALRRAGVEVLPARWSGRWLARHLRRGDALALDWPSFHYYAPGRAARTWFGLARFAALLALLRLRGVRIVWTAHNLYPHDGGRALRAHRVGRRLVTGLASAIGVHGAAAAERVRGEFGVSAARLLPLEHGHWIGYYPNAIARDAARARLGIAARDYVYLFIGICKPYKNLEALIAAHGELADDSRLWIAGHFQSDDYRARVTHAATAAGARVTVHAGHVAPGDLQLYLNACDAVVLPYREILTSGAAMLALSFGRPVIAPRLGALAELVTDDCGVLYDPGADGALSAAMRAARARTFDAAALLARAREYSWDRSAQTLAGWLRRGP